MTDHTSVDIEEYVSLDRVVQLTVKLVQFDTCNPPGDEAAVISALCEELESLDCEVDVFRSATGRPSVLARHTPPGSDLPVLLVNGHIDVVPVNEADWSVPPFAGTVHEGRIIGRGTTDMKGGIAAALEGLRACLDAGVSLGAEIHFHLVADEETGGAEGTRALVEAGLVRANACIVPEPTQLRVAVAERGSFQARVVVRGIAGHGGEPLRGRSAIADAAVMVSALHGATFHESPHPLLGRPSCNVSTIQGGIATNVIAPFCEFMIDRRTLPGETAEEILDLVRERIERACPGADYRIEPTLFVESSELETSHPLVGFVVDRAGELAAGGVVGLSLGTDARFLRNQLGIPTVIYGPGSMAQAHAADEWVDVTELHQAALTFARIFRDFAGKELQLEERRT